MPGLDKLAASVLGAAGAAALTAAMCSSCESEPLGPAADGGQDALDAPDSASTADADSATCAPLPDTGTVLTDPAVWKCVPDDRGCGTYVANAMPDPFPKFTWKGCGGGCEVADAVLPVSVSNSTSWTSSGATTVGNQIVTRLHIYAEQGVSLFLASRLADSATIYAVQDRHCIAGTPTNDGALGLPIFKPSGEWSVERVRAVRAPSADPAAKLEWSSWIPTPALPTSFFAWEDGWGATFQDGTVRAVTSADATSFTVLDTASTVYEVASRNHLVAWPGDDGTGRRQVKAWGLQNGLQVLWTTAQGLDAAASEYVNSVALSDQRLVWIVVNGPGYKFTQARVLWSPFATLPSEVQVTEGPSIPAIGSLHELRTGGDYAAAHGCYETGPETGECSVFVVRFSTKQIWKIPPRPGGTYLNVMAVSDEYVLVGETNNPVVGDDSKTIRRLVRFQTSQLDALEAAW